MLYNKYTFIERFLHIESAAKHTLNIQHFFKKVCQNMYCTEIFLWFVAFVFQVVMTTYFSCLVA
jgi:hypothetical protein